MKELQKELKEKLGDKVLFRKAKHNPKFLSDTTKKVADYVVAITEGKRSSVGYNSSEEVIEIQAQLTEKKIADLNNRFSADILRITNEEPDIHTAVTANHE